MRQPASVFKTGHIRHDGGARAELFPKAMHDSGVGICIFTEIICIDNQHDGFDLLRIRIHNEGKQILIMVRSQRIGQAIPACRRVNRIHSFAGVSTVGWAALAKRSFTVRAESVHSFCFGVRVQVPTNPGASQHE